MNQSGQESRQIAKSGEKLKEEYVENRSDLIDQVLSKYLNINTCYYCGKGLSITNDSNWQSQTTPLPPSLSNVSNPLTPPPPSMLTLLINKMYIRLSRFSQNLWYYLFTPFIPLYGQFWTQNDKDLFKRKCFGVAPFYLKKCQKYKGFSKFIRGKNFRSIFQFFYVKTFFHPKLNQQVGLLRSRRFFRHQDWPNWKTSYFDVICVIWHQMTFDVKWRIWHQIYDTSQMCRYWCLKKRLGLSNPTCWFNLG